MAQLGSLKEPSHDPGVLRRPSPGCVRLAPLAISATLLAGFLAATAAFARPHVIGYFRCQYWNQWMPAPRNLLKQGLRQADGRPYEEMIRRVADINARLLKETP